MKLNIKDIQRHRNGICGSPFHVVTFQHDEYGSMAAIVFDEAHHVAVLQVDKLANGDVAFGSNSWRGDHFEPALRRAIREATSDVSPTPSPHKLIRMLLDEIESLNDPQFSDEQADFLERRLAEIRFALESEGQP